MSVQQEKFTEIADAIRSKTGETGLIKPSDFASKVDEVYDAGKENGLDIVWEGLQQSGARTEYAHLFKGAHDLDKWFYPKYDFNCTTCEQMFRGAKTTEPFNLADRLDECGVTFDTSAVTNISWVFAYFTNLTELPVISFEGLTDTYYTNNCFTGCSKLKTIRGIVPTPPTPDGRTQYWDMFSGCTALEDLTIIGTMHHSLSVSPCTALTHKSLMSIIDNLADYSGTGTSRTLTLGTINLAKLTDAEKAIATERGWTLA